MKLTPAQRELLQAIYEGQILKSHRDLAGRKEYRLHTMTGQSSRITWETVAALQDLKLIDSNKKFPAATYWLTEAGRAQLVN